MLTILKPKQSSKKKQTAIAKNSLKTNHASWNFVSKLDDFERDFLWMISLGVEYSYISEYFELNLYQIETKKINLTIKYNFNSFENLISVYSHYT